MTKRPERWPERLLLFCAHNPRSHRRSPYTIEALFFLYPTDDPGPALQLVRKQKDLAYLAEAAKAAPELFTGFYYLAAVAAAPEIKAICARYSEDENEALLLLLGLFTDAHPDPLEVIRKKFQGRYRNEKKRLATREEAPELFSPRTHQAPRAVLLKSELDALTQQERRIFWLLYDGARPEEIAELFGITAGAARQQIFRLRKKLGNAAPNSDRE